MELTPTERLRYGFFAVAGFSFLIQACFKLCYMMVANPDEQSYLYEGGKEVSVRKFVRILFYGREIFETAFYFSTAFFTATIVKDYL